MLAAPLRRAPTPVFEPSEEQRRLVRAMAGFGMPQENIATPLAIDPKTLRKHFRQELNRGAIQANVKVAQSLFQMATEGRNVAAAIFWMKSRAGWRERHDIHVSTAAVHQLSDDALLRMITASGKLVETDTSG